MSNTSVTLPQALECLSDHVAYELEQNINPTTLNIPNGSNLKSVLVKENLLAPPHTQALEGSQKARVCSKLDKALNAALIPDAGCRKKTKTKNHSEKSRDEPRNM